MTAVDDAQHGAALTHGAAPVAERFIAEPMLPPGGADPFAGHTASTAAARPAGVSLLEHLRGGARRWTRREIARTVGVSTRSAKRLWRALGFANVGDDEVFFTDGDVEGLTRTVGLVRSGLVDEATAIVLARALGQTTDRLVSWHTEALLEHLARVGGIGAARIGENPARIIEAHADELEALLVYTWRRQLAAALRRIDDDESDGDPSAASELTVGFADLVSYTKLTHDLPQSLLGELVQRFEGLASDVVNAGGGKVVKTIGDEVLFTAAEPEDGAAIALTLSEHMAVDEVIPDVRVGLAHGLVLRRLGDVYGTTVNLASRLTSLAQPGTVVTDPMTAAMLAAHPDLVLVPQRRRQVRGFGPLQPLLIARADPTTELITLD